MALSIIIPTYNRDHMLVACIRSITAALTDAEIIVVNDSRTHTPDLSFAGSSVKLLQNPGSGVASARNFGVQHASHAQILFLDDDMIVNKPAVECIKKFLEAHNDKCININWIYPPELTERIRKTKFGRYLINNGHADLKGWMDPSEWKDNSIFPIKTIASAILGLHKSSFEKANGYDEQFPYAGFEDYDFAARLNKSGTQGYLNTQVCVYHNEEDRVEIRSWLERRRRNGLTRAIGVYKLGYKEFTIDPPGWKKFLFRLIYLFRWWYRLDLFFIPNLSLFDGLYKFCMGPLLGAYIYMGYTEGKK